jgi:hypothetical protein
MKLTRLVPRIALIASLAAGACGLVATQAAEADTTVNAPVITGVTGITPESATLHGVIDSGDIAPGSDYVFEYDTLADYKANSNQFGDNAGFTPDVPGFVTNNTGLIVVNGPAGCYPVASCANLGGIPLSPGTTYVYQLQSQPGTAAGTYSSTESLSSPVGTFKTPALGTVKVAKKATVSGNSASIALTDSSVEKAAGTYAVTVKLKGKSHKVASGKFSIAAGAVKSISAKLTKSELALVKSLKLTKLTAKVALTTTTDQKAPTASVTVKL